MVFNFLKAPSCYSAENSADLQDELAFYGIEVGRHYIVDETSDVARFDWIELSE